MWLRPSSVSLFPFHPTLRLSPSNESQPLVETRRDTPQDCCTGLFNVSLKLPGDTAWYKLRMKPMRGEWAQKWRYRKTKSTLHGNLSEVHITVCTQLCTYLCDVHLLHQSRVSLMFRALISVLSPGPITCSFFRDICWLNELMKVKKLFKAILGNLVESMPDLCTIHTLDNSVTIHQDQFIGYYQVWMGEMVKPVRLGSQRAFCSNDVRHCVINFFSSRKQRSLEPHSTLCNPCSSFSRSYYLISHGWHTASILWKHTFLQTWLSRNANGGFWSNMAHEGFQ